MDKRRGRPTAVIELSGEESEVLERWARRPKSSQALALRCRIVLAAAQGRHSNEIAVALGCHAATVSKWRNRFALRRLDGLCDDLRSGPPRKISDEVIEAVIVRTLESTPQNATHWSTRSMAKAAGVSQTAVSQIWRAFGLKPHLTEDFKVSPDPQFIDKVRDVVGLCLNPPDAAVVLCVDEKTGVQALDRTSVILALMPRHAPAPQPRLQAQRHHQPVRRARHRVGQGDRLDDRAAPRRGIPQVLEPHRQRDPRTPRRAHRVGQRLHPQDPRHQTLATCATPASHSTSPPPTAPR